MRGSNACLAVLLATGCGSTMEKAPPAPRRIEPAAPNGTPTAAALDPEDARPPFGAEACSGAPPRLGKRVQIAAPMSAANAGADACSASAVALGAAQTGSLPVVAAGPRGGIAAWQEDEHTVAARLLGPDLAPRTPKARVGRFDEPTKIVVIPTEQGGAVLTLSTEAEGPRWYASFLDAEGRVLVAPLATGLDPDQLVRETFATEGDVLAVLQYPIYLAGMIPEAPKPILLAALDRDHPNTCPLRVDLEGYVDWRHEVVIVDGGKGPGFAVRHVDGVDTPLPPLDESPTLLVHAGGAERDFTGTPGGDTLALMLYIGGGNPLVRMVPHTMGSVGPPIDLSGVLGSDPIQPQDIEIGWTGKRATAAVRTTEGEARFVVIDCTP